MQKQSKAIEYYESSEQLISKEETSVVDKGFDLDEIKHLTDEIKEKDTKIAELMKTIEDMQKSNQAVCYVQAEEIRKQKEKINRIEEPIWIIDGGRVVKYNPDYPYVYPLHLF